MMPIDFAVRGPAGLAENVINSLQGSIAAEPPSTIGLVVVADIKFRFLLYALGHMLGDGNPICNTIERIPVQKLR